MSTLEDAVVGHMRAAIAVFDTDHEAVGKHTRLAHELFSDNFTEWSESFCTLYNGMLEIYRAYTPHEKGHYETRHIGIGYSSFPVSRWIVEKIQPVKPTATELVERFDGFVRAWKAER
jgi:hypothetical protein